MPETYQVQRVSANNPVRHAFTVSPSGGDRVPSRTSLWSRTPNRALAMRLNLPPVFRRLRPAY